MVKFSKFKTAFLFIIVAILLATCFVPKGILFAENNNNNVSIYYALITMGLNNVKDKDSMVIDETVGVLLELDDLSETEQQFLKQDLKNKMEEYSLNLKSKAILLTTLAPETITISSAQVQDNLIYVKIVYTSLNAYYLFNNKQISSEENVKPYDRLEKGLFANKHFIDLNNPFGENGKQTALNLFKTDYFDNVIRNIDGFTRNYNIDYVFDYSLTDKRMYGDFAYSYSIQGLNQTVYVYEFIYKDEIPNTTSLYFLTFNQYIWYVIAIAITLVVTGVIGIIIFVKHIKQKK